MNILKQSLAKRFFMYLYQQHRLLEAKIENAQNFDEKAKWAFWSGFCRSGIFWLS